MTTIAEEAREAALLQLDLAYDHFRAVERRERREDHEAAAEGARIISTWLRRAYDAERNDPKPWGLAVEP